MPTVPDALLYLGFDDVDEMIMANVTRALETAKAVLRGAVGADVEKYLPNDSRVDELVLIYLDDLYSNRGVETKAGAGAKVSSATRLLVAGMELQLRLELRAAKEAGAT